MSRRLNRRRFLQTSGAVGLGYLFTGPAFSVAKAAGANDRLRVAGIGTGGKGRSDIEQAGQLMDVVALCDADEQRGFGGIKFDKAEKFTDYRKLFDAPAAYEGITADDVRKTAAAMLRPGNRTVGHLVPPTTASAEPSAGGAQ